MSHNQETQRRMGHSLLNVLDLCRSTAALGPGKRYAIWVQGCLKNCPGCGTPEGRSIGINRLIEVAELAEDILDQHHIEGITISGGEPFLQAKVLANLVRLIRLHKDMGVIVFTGYYLQELRDLDDHDTNNLLDCIDLLIDGPYVEDMNDNLGLRGSANQTMWYLTERYKEYCDFIEIGPRKLEITKTQIIGIKPRAFDKTIEYAFARMLNRKLRVDQ